jgi:hypothetical protein
MRQLLCEAIWQAERDRISERGIILGEDTQSFPNGSLAEDWDCLWNDVGGEG